MERVKILKVLDIINDSVSYYDGLRPFLSTGDLNLSKIEKLENLTFEEKPSRANLNVKEGDIILARMQGTIKVKVIDNAEQNIIVSTGFLVLRKKDNVDLDYLFNYLKTPIFQNDKNGLCTGATQKAINNGNFAKIEIPLPPLTTQKTIAAKLDKAQEIISYNKQLVEKYDQLTQSLFIDMFGDPVDNQKKWSVQKLRTGIKNLQSGLSLSGEERLLKDDEIAVLKISAVTSGIFKSTEHKVVNKLEIKKSIIFPKKGDLLFSRANTREKVGAVAIVDKDYDNLFLPDKLWRIDTNDLLNNVFLKFILSHKGFRHNIERVSTGTSGSMLNISMQKFLNIESPFPPMQLQQRFAQSIETIEIQKQWAQESLAKSEHLFQSLLKESFK